jgi:hypothetical protein
MVQKLRQGKKTPDIKQEIKMKEKSLIYGKLQLMVKIT